MNRSHFLSVLTAVLILFLGINVGNVLADLIWPIPGMEDEQTSGGIDYLILVNKENALPENWEDEIEFAYMTNPEDNGLKSEKRTCDAFFSLKEALAKEDIHVGLHSAYRSIEEQQQIVEKYTGQYGEEYVRQHTAVPGFSEHHTGLALDLYLIIGGVAVDRDEEMLQYPEIWTKIHAVLADYGFILRYPEDKEDITGYSYKPWHIRYLDSTAFAKEIMDQGLTLEEYLK